MKSIKNCIIFVLLSIITVDLIECTDFVPVYMWGNVKVTNHVPALHKTSEATFKDHLQEYMKEDPFIIVFAEYNLSPEDFSQKNSLGEAAFTNLPEFKESSHVDYRPKVGNAISAIKKLNKPVTELSITSLLNNPDVPNNNILIIELNDAKDDEDRFKMLKRHDSQIASIYKYFAKKHSNIMALYTAHHTSIVTPDDDIYKQPRHLLATDDKDSRILFKDTEETVYMFLNNVGTLNITNERNSTIDDEFKVTATKIQENGVTNISFTLKNELTLTFNFLIDVNAYWSLSSIEIEGASKKISFEPKTIFAPLSFSYHCNDLILSTKLSDEKTVTLTMPGLQLQPFLSSNSTEERIFGDAYDCVGFTSVPIWSGLFVTFILLLIMTFGLTMMMDIKTMDRFDDAKGKTITINASE